MLGLHSEAFFLDAPSGRRFCILHRPSSLPTQRGVILHLHAFAEEMNKSRRMVALGARALAQRGWVVLLMDLGGCGDSAGEFEEASWQGWHDDALFAHQWAASQWDRCWLWGLRAGCLIAVEASARLGGAVPLLLWQPVVSGQLHLTQFLRLKLANEALTQQSERTGTKALRQRLAQGEALEIGGYRLSPSLAIGLDRAELAFERQLERVVWCQLATEGGGQLPASAQARMSTLRERGVAHETVVVQGAPFWQTLEIEQCEELVDATVRALDS